MNLFNTPDFQIIDPTPPFEVYENQHMQPTTPVIKEPKKINLNDTSDPRRQKFIEKIKRKLEKNQKK